MFEPKVFRVFMIVLASLGLYFFNSTYFIFSFQIILGLLTFPFLVQPKTDQRFLWRYGLISLIFLIAALVLHLQVLLFFAWACLWVFMLEWHVGSLGFLPLFFIGAISPALFYVVNIFSFPLRLELSEITCKAFQMIGMKLSNKGSYFILSDGTSFHVDEACVGLKMFGTGYISSLLILAYWERKVGKSWTFFQVGVALILATFLLVLSNLIRLFALVLFRSMPETASHEAIGLMSLLVYVIVPFYFFANYFSKVHSRVRFEPKPYTSRFKTSLPIALLFLMLAGSLGFGQLRKEGRQDVFLENLALPGFQKQLKEDGVMQFKNDSLLIYIKPAIRAFEGGHPPHICWQASGFSLCDFNERKMGESSYMFGTLKQGTHKQYTVWWYDNGSVQTIHEWEWRSREKGLFRVVNMNALDSAFLWSQVEQWKLRNPLMSQK